MLEEFRDSSVSKIGSVCLADSLWTRSNFTNATNLHVCYIHHQHSEGIMGNTLHQLKQRNIGLSLSHSVILEKYK